MIQEIRDMAAKTFKEVAWACATLVERTFARFCLTLRVRCCLASHALRAFSRAG